MEAWRNCCSVCLSLTRLFSGEEFWEALWLCGGIETVHTMYATSPKSCCDESVFSHWIENDKYQDDGVSGAIARKITNGGHPFVSRWEVRCSKSTEVVFDDDICPIASQSGVASCSVSCWRRWESSSRRRPSRRGLKMRLGLVVKMVLLQAGGFSRFGQHECTTSRK